MTFADPQGGDTVFVDANVLIYHIRSPRRVRPVSVGRRIASPSFY